MLQDNASITSEVLDKLTYMDQVCFSHRRHPCMHSPFEVSVLTLVTCQVLKETLRLYPPIPGVIRLVPKGYDLSGYVMPEDTEVMVGYILYKKNFKEMNSYV